jgi:hypothetical protein
VNRVSFRARLPTLLALGAFDTYAGLAGHRNSRASLSWAALASRLPLPRPVPAAVYLEYFSARNSPSSSVAANSLADWRATLHGVVSPKISRVARAGQQDVLQIVGYVGPAQLAPSLPSVHPPLVHSNQRLISDMLWPSTRVNKRPKQTTGRGTCTRGSHGINLS